MAHQHETLLRQWQMLRHIPRYPLKITARALKERLDAEGFIISKRTIERDLNSLSLTFPLVQDNRDKQYGWSWQKDAPAFDLPGLGNNEALTLIMVEQHLSSLLPSSTLEVLSPYFRTAHKKLEEGIKNKSIKSWLNKVRTITPNQTLIAPEINARTHKTITDALLLDKQLEITYKNREGTVKTYSVHPLGLVQRGVLVYLSARINEFDNLIMLALHRVLNAEMLSKDTEHPADYNIDDEIAKGVFDFGKGELIQFTGIFSAEAGKHLLETPLSSDQQAKQLNDEYIQITATLVNTPQLKWWLLALGSGVEVITPLALRESVLSTLQEASNLYK
jgi:predicted DNA-binding transcriptional regulator YafY